MGISGKCLCGGIRFETARVPMIGLCHCSMCRKAYGGPFSAEAVIPSSDFRFTAGADLVKTYESSPDVRRAFCSVCGSRAPFQALDQKFYLVPAGLLDDDPGVKPSFHMFVASKAPWWEITDGYTQFDGWVPGYGPSEKS